MQASGFEDNIKPGYDQVIIDIVNYVFDYQINNSRAYETARLCLMDSIGCGILALNFPECKKMLGPLVPTANLPLGARVPGTHFSLSPVEAAFNIGTMIRWLDFNDTWLAAEWGHPSDNLGAILAVADYVSRGATNKGKPGLVMQDVLTAMIKAHEIQGCLALENAFNRVGLDHVFLVKIASAAVIIPLLGGDKDLLSRTLSQVFVDGQALRTYRHAPNAGSRKSWAAGDATARAVFLAFLSLKGEMGYPSALTAPGWGFYDVLFHGKPFKFQRPYGDYVMENILFKLAWPAEFHAQTAVEAAIKLHPQVVERLDEIERIELVTHESAIRIISKQGPLHNPADRDHCLQYMVAIGLIFGDLTASHYEAETAADPRIDRLRALIQVTENIHYSKDYHDPEKRSITNALRIYFKDGSKTDEIKVEYPIGHKRRREEGIPVLYHKFQKNLETQFTTDKTVQIISQLNDMNVLAQMKVEDFMGLFVKENVVESVPEHQTLAESR